MKVTITNGIPSRPQLTWKQISEKPGIYKVIKSDLGHSPSPDGDDYDARFLVTKPHATPVLMRFKNFFISSNADWNQYLFEKTNETIIIEG